jgi:hypothetical protein
MLARDGDNSAYRVSWRELCVAAIEAPDSWLNRWVCKAHKVCLPNA